MTKEETKQLAKEIKMLLKLIPNPKSIKLSEYIWNHYDDKTAKRLIKELDKL